MANAPEALAAWELTLTLGGPGVRVMPERNGRGAIAKVDHATWVQKLCAGQRHVQMLQQSGMTASGLQPSHLGRPNIEHPWTTPERSRTSPRLLMRFQLERARDWFARSEAGVRWLSADARWPVWTSLRLYRGILDEICLLYTSPSPRD